MPNPNEITAAPGPQRILLVDDDVEIRENGRRTLEELYEVETCENGREALGAIARRPPDLVLTDAVMPELDGFALLAAIRKNPQTQDLPVIFISGGGTERCRDALKAGADDFLTKPFRRAELLARIDARLEVSHRRRVSAENERRLRRLAEQAQEASERAAMRLRHFIDSNVVGVVVANDKGAILEANNYFLRLTGLTREEVEAGTVRWDEVTASEFEAVHRAAIAEARESGGSNLHEMEYIRRDGTRATVLVALACLQGECSEYAGLVLDITDRKRAEQALRAERERLREGEEQMRLAVEIAQLGTFTIDLETDAAQVNEVGRDIYGFGPGQPLTFALVQSHFHPDDKEEVMQSVRAAFAPGGSGEFEVEQRIIRTDGALRWIRVHGRAFAEGEGEKRRAVRCVGTFLDITRRKEVERVLREADRRKDEFLAMLAHELRNPLAGIRTAIEVLATQEDRESFDWATGVVKRQSAQLTRMVDDLLDVSRITSGKIKLRKSRLDLADVLANAVAAVRLLLQQRGHEFTTDFDQNGPLLVEGDSTRLEQIVVNLLTNASKYTPAGGRISLAARNEAGQITITVQDNGMGIPPTRVPEMFELFAQGERSIDRSEGGLGLGLTIVKMLTELHGGSVSAHSEGPGKGSIFFVRIPAGTEAADFVPILQEPVTYLLHGVGGRVLVVDDNVDTATGMSRLLRAQGYTVETAFDGPSAVKKGRTFRPGFVLLDIGLPGMTGYEVAAKLRREQACKNALLVAISGYGQGEDIRRSHEAGFDHHMVKPVDWEELQQVMNAPAVL